MSTYLERKLVQVNQEIGRYPGPIARCDEHLAALLEERARLVAELEKTRCSAEALWANDGGGNAA